MMASVLSNLTSSIMFGNLQLLTSCVLIPDVDELDVLICVLVVYFITLLVWISCLPKLVWLRVLFGFPFFNLIDF